MAKELGRIYFPGNPWPRGHRITNFEWTGRVERSSGIWFDLQLETENYYAGDRPAGDDADLDDESDSDWESKTVWSNSHSCTLSSTKWNGYGFLAGTSAEPLDWSRLNRRTFVFDQKPKDLRPPRPFGIYLTGHDAVSDHKIEIRREPGKKTFAFNWLGRIALKYSGDEKFRYTFKANVAGIRFGGIQFPGDMTSQDARLSLVPFVSNLRQFNIRKEKSKWVALPA